jgi:hypothetical protein
MNNQPDPSQQQEHLTYTYAFATVMMAIHFGIDNPSTAIWPVVLTALFLSEMARRGKSMGIRYTTTRTIEVLATAAFTYFGWLLWIAR